MLSKGDELEKAHVEGWRIACRLAAEERLLFIYRTEGHCQRIMFCMFVEISSGNLSNPLLPTVTFLRGPVAAVINIWVPGTCLAFSKVQ